MEFKNLAANAVFIGSVLASSAVFAIGNIDIRADQVLTDTIQDVNYRITVEDCTQLATISVSGQSLDSSDAIRSSDSNACEFAVQVSSYAPVVTATDISGNSYSHAETFYFETINPSISFNGVSITGTSQDQYLAVSVTATDDVDVRYISADILGLRASSLTEAGGVVDIAAQSAFANTDGYTTIYPSSNTQTEFVIYVPVEDALSASEILYDGVVLMDVNVVDASGNSASFNQLSFTGTDVNETVESMRVTPEAMVLTNALDRQSLTTYVEFEFRGEVLLNTTTSGLSYSSADTSKVLVSSSGVVYPIAETPDGPVDITIS